MLFNFNKYISPGWYFNLKPKGNIPYFVDYELLTDAQKSIIDFDNNYSSIEVSKLDAAYQGFWKGLITDPKLQLSFTNIKPTVSDNYRFVKKNYNKIWVYYIFILRILTFKNPIKEVKGLISTFNVNRNNIFGKINEYKSFEKFNSPLIKSNACVSIVIPTLNRYDYISDVLNDLEAQTYKNFKVLIIDQSEPFQPDYYKGYDLDIQIINQKEKALWLARNSGIRISDCQIIALTEDDVRLPANWLESHLKCLDFFNADISNGIFFPSGGDIPKSKQHFRYSDQFATGNSCLYKEVFFQTGLFDRQFERMRSGDGEFGLRAYLAGKKSISNPSAYCEDVKASSGGLRQMGSWDSFRPKKLLAPRPIPSILYYMRRYFGNKAAILGLIINVPPSYLPYKFKQNKLIYIGGILLCIFALPFILYSVTRSWLISTKMIKTGPKIDTLSHNNI